MCLGLVPEVSTREDLRDLVMTFFLLTNAGSAAMVQASALFPIVYQFLVDSGYRNAAKTLKEEAALVRTVPASLAVSASDRLRCPETYWSGTSLTARGLQSLLRAHSNVRRVLLTDCRSSPENLCVQ